MQMKRHAQPLNPIQIQYLYMRSFFPEIAVPGQYFRCIELF